MNSNVSQKKKIVSVRVEITEIKIEKKGVK